MTAPQAYGVLRPLRLWPGVVAVGLQWLVRFVLPVIVPGAALYGVLGGIFLGLVVLLWWLFFSRVPWTERLGATLLMVVALLATFRIVHKSIATGMMGMMLPISAIPVLSLALVASAVASRRHSTGARRATMAAAILLACGVFTLLRTGGITGDAASDLHWRWTPTPEERLLARGADELAAPPSTPTDAPGPVKPVPSPTSGEPTAPASAAAVAERAGASESRTDVKPASAPGSHELVARAADPVDRSGADAIADWSGFRGPDRDGTVHGSLLFTQEQRGDDEVVSAYKLTSGAPVWRHRDAVRFWESNGGAGPRATPTFSNGRVYTFGATGILNAPSGSVIWSRNAAADTGTKVPGWGFASSPLVVADVVIVATAGTLAAYDLTTGEPRWVGRAGGWGYSSPQLVTIDGVEQIVLLNGGGATSVAPADGTPLWDSPWSGGNIVQPALTAEGDILIGAIDSSASGIGMRRIAVAHGTGGWTVEERWTSTGLKPSFNDYVVHKGHAFGFDGSILACIDLTDGTRKWKGGRYGHGQLIVLPDQDLLLVLSEEGELALVAAASDQFKELARFHALEGKTWNHPALVGDVLLVRNGEEMAAFRLSLAGR